MFYPDRKLQADWQGVQNYFSQFDKDVKSVVEPVRKKANIILDEAGKNAWKYAEKANTNVLEVSRGIRDWFVSPPVPRTKPEVQKSMPPEVTPQTQEEIDFYNQHPELDPKHRIPMKRILDEMDSQARPQN